MENTDYLSNIPDELKLLIFSYLDTFDVIHLEEVSSKLEHLTYDKKLISSIRLYKDYRCNISHLRKILQHKLRQDVITSLNINCIYWVSRIELRKCLKLPMLECLYALDTKLGLNDLVDFNLSRLHTLGITIIGTNFHSYSKLIFLNNLKHLYIHFDVDMRDLYLLSTFIDSCRSLEELWVIDVSEEAHITYSIINIANRIPSTIKKVILSFSGSHSQMLLQKLGFDFKSFKMLKTKMHVCLDKNTDGNVANLYDESFYQMYNWKDYIVRLKCDYPFGLNDAQKLLFKESTLEDILWEELNLSHQSSLCSTFYRCVLDSILVTPNSKRLKRLSINTCSAQPKCLEIVKRRRNEPLFKKERVAHSAGSSEKSTLQEVIRNSPLLEHLEIWECEMVLKGLPKLANDALNSIKKLERLQKLTLSGIPNYVSPKYILDIFQNCTNLTSLRITSSQQNASLSNYLCMSIPYAKSLKDLRFEQDTIPVCRLVESFCMITPPKLERLTIKCNDLPKFNLQSFKKFLKHNPQLKFLCLCITNVNKSFNQSISRQLQKLKNPGQIFLIVNSLHNARIPYHHKIDMLRCTTAVSTIDVFNGFVKY